MQQQTIQILNPANSSLMQNTQQVFTCQNTLLNLQSMILQLHFQGVSVNNGTTQMAADAVPGGQINCYVRLQDLIQSLKLTVNGVTHFQLDGVALEMLCGYRYQQKMNRQNYKSNALVEPNKAILENNNQTYPTTELSAIQKKSMGVVFSDKQPANYILIGQSTLQVIIAADAAITTNQTFYLNLSLCDLLPQTLFNNNYVDNVSQMRIEVQYSNIKNMVVLTDANYNVAAINTQLGTAQQPTISQGNLSSYIIYDQYIQQIPRIPIKQSYLNEYRTKQKNINVLLDSSFMVLEKIFFTFRKLFQAGDGLLHLDLVKPYNVDFIYKLQIQLGSLQLCNIDRQSIPIFLQNHYATNQIGFNQNYLDYSVFCLSVLQQVQNGQNIMIQYDTLGEQTYEIIVLVQYSSPAQQEVV